MGGWVFAAEAAGVYASRFQEGGSVAAAGAVEVYAAEDVEVEAGAEAGGEQEHAGCLHREAGSASLQGPVAGVLFAASRPAT